MTKKTSTKTKMYLLASFFALSLTPFIVFGQPSQGTDTSGTDTTGAPRAVPVNEGLQPLQVNQTGQGSGTTNSNQSGRTNTATGAASCIAASGLVGFAQNAISSIVGGFASPTRVPTGNAVQEGKETGILGVISWDQIGWCLVNSVIESITAATVQWIEGGFEGNPVFVDDPAGYFTNLADIQAGQFFYELGGGFLCSPIQDIVRVNLSSAYNKRISPYGNQAQCTFSEISGNLEQFMSGDSFSWGDWMSFTQNPQNNPMGATIFGQIELDRRIAQTIGLESTKLDWGAGFFSVKDKETGKITSPGAVIENQINQRLFSGQRRLEIADEFNEVVNALVNQVIKMAVSEMTQSGSSSSRNTNISTSVNTSPTNQQTLTITSKSCTETAPFTCIISWDSSNIPNTAVGSLIYMLPAQATSGSTSNNPPRVINANIPNTGVYTWTSRLEPGEYTLTLSFGTVRASTPLTVRAAQ